MGFQDREKEVNELSDLINISIRYFEGEHVYAQSGPEHEYKDFEIVIFVGKEKAKIKPLGMKGDAGTIEVVVAELLHNDERVKRGGLIRRRQKNGRPAYHTIITEKNGWAMPGPNVMHWDMFVKPEPGFFFKQVFIFLYIIFIKSIFVI